MAIYAFSTLPLIDSVKQIGLTQTGLGEDACGGSMLETIHSWWLRLVSEGPKYGYFVNPQKTWLLVKDQHQEKAKELFGDTGVSITSAGRPLLGSPIGKSTYQEEFVSRQVSDRVGTKFEEAVKDCRETPQVAFTAFTHGLAGTWGYLARTCGDIDNQCSALEGVIRRELIPAMTGRNVSDVERDLLGLRARFGGLGLPNPSGEAPFSFSLASKVTQALVEHLLLPDGKELPTALAAKTEAVVESRKAKNIRWKEKVAAVKERLDLRLQRTVDAAEDKGASSWLTALPIADLGFSLSNKWNKMSQNHTPLLQHLDYCWFEPKDDFEQLFKF